MSGAGIVSTVAAAPLTGLSATQGNPQSLTSSQYAIGFSIASTTDIQAIRIQFATRPSGSPVAPNDMDASGAALTSFSLAALDLSNWDVTATTSEVILNRNTTGTAATGLSSGNAGVITLATITNPDATHSGVGECDSVANSETCYIRITTYSDDSTNPSTAIDTGAMSFTTTSVTTVSATIDPSLTFTVNGVAAANINSVDTGTGCTTVGNNVTSTATTIPFGNITVGTAKCGQHQLIVGSNSVLGYTVAHKFWGASSTANLLVDVSNSSNNIDPFSGSGATWGVPQTFDGSTVPTGTAANVDSGWLGIRPYNPNGTAAGAFGAVNAYAPPAVNATTARGNNVMARTQTDTGLTGSASYVTYKINVNFAQPAGTYQGTASYNVVANY
jgi:hypothetical protein